ncbi:MAG: hypothetical protein PHE78_06830 [Candidatus Gastranaerophilales bacterium]|nr:hypothetical protein [Candidatus Gastranaerophilales bacterium]
MLSIINIATFHLYQRIKAATPKQKQVYKRRFWQHKAQNRNKKRILGILSLRHNHLGYILYLNNASVF